MSHNGLKERPVSDRPVTGFVRWPTAHTHGFTRRTRRFSDSAGALPYDGSAPAINDRNVLLTRDSRSAPLAETETPTVAVSFGATRVATDNHADWRADR